MGVVLIIIVPWKEVVPWTERGCPSSFRGDENDVLSLESTACPYSEVIQRVHYQRLYHSSNRLKFPTLVYAQVQASLQPYI